MLYVTTRNRTDSFTAHRALHETAAPDGGSFLPIRIPEYSAEEIEKLKELSFSEAVALVLNRFFSVSLTGWDVAFSVGKSPISIIAFGRKLYCARLWRNEKRHADYIYGRLYALVCNKPYTGKQPTGWAALAIRIALLFGFTSELLRKDISGFDVAVQADDFESVMAAWYARAMGLPVENVICGCNNFVELWDLIHKGEAGISSLHEHPGVEKLIYLTLGLDENLRYLASKSTYKIDKLRLGDFNRGLYASVIGSKRTVSTIHSIYRTERILFEPDVAVAYCALQDHRTKTGESKPTLLLSESAPELHIDAIMSATGISEVELRALSDLA